MPKVCWIVLRIIIIYYAKSSGRQTKTRKITPSQNSRLKKIIYTSHAKHFQMKGRVDYNFFIMLKLTLPNLEMPQNR